MEKNVLNEAALKESFSRVKEKKSLVEREFALLHEVSRFDIPLEIYRRLFDNYVKGNIDDPILDDYPKFSLQNWRNVAKQWREWIKLQDKWILSRKVLWSVLEKGALLSLGFSSVHYLLSIPERQKQAHYQAWQVIHGAMNDSGEGGRITALQELANDGVSLNGLYAKKANLLKIKLRKANLQKAELEDANFEDAVLQYVDFQYARLDRASFRLAHLKNVNLTASFLSFVNFDEADLREVKLDKAILREARFFKSKLQYASFKDAELENADFSDANIDGANFRGALNLTAAQIKHANNWNTAQYDRALSTSLGLSDSTENPGQDQESCKRVDSRQEWQLFTFNKNVTNVSKITGRWSINDKTPEWYVGEEGIDPKFPNQKIGTYIPKYRWGVLLIAKEKNLEATLVHQGESLPFKAPIRQVYMRINDGDQYLGDNEGVLTVCFE